jgi:hypothetical protein
MNSILCRRQHSEIDHTAANATHHHEAAKVAIASYKDAALGLGFAKQIDIGRTRHSNLGNGDDIMAQRPQKSDRDRVDILIHEKLHGDGTAK